MPRFDVDGFLASLAPRGVPEAQLPVYRDGIDALLVGVSGGFEQRQLDEALARAALTGASERRLANLRTIGEQMLAFQRGGNAATMLGTGASRAPARTTEPPHALEVALPPPRAIDVPLPPPRATEPPRAAAVAPASPDGGGLELARPVARVAPLEVAVPARKPVTPGGAEAILGPSPLPGCACRTRQDVYLDDYWQNLGKIVTGVMGLVGLTILIVFPSMLAVVVALGVTTTGALITALTVGWRCESCRRWIARRGLDADQRRDVRTRSLVFFGITAVLGVMLLFAVGKLREQLAREEIENRAMRALRDLDRD